jgi:biopolymer transport protein ExbD
MASTFIVEATMDSNASHGVQATPNVTPMIDVMLVLLVVFMVAAPALLVGIPAIPPVARNTSNHPEEKHDQVLGIDRGGAFYLNKHSIRVEDLPARLKAIYANRQDDKVLYVRADKDVAYASVLTAVDIASKNGVAVVGMILDRPPVTVRGGPEQR